MSRFQLTAATLILLAVSAGCSDGNGGSPSTSEPTRSTTSSAVANPNTQASPTTVTETTPTPTPTTTVVESAGPWDVWTLIYASLDAGEYDRADAEQVALAIEDGGVLLSDDYPSLNAGYWVVYGGEWASREFAGNQCPPGLDESLSCYPRYLGDGGSALDADWAVVEYNYGLVLLDTSTGEIERTIRESFAGDGAFAGTFALDRVNSDLYYGLGYEDWWYSCDTAMGLVERLDLETGARQRFSDGWATGVSPNGRWLAVTAPSDCYPDPDNANWVLAPSDTIYIYDLAQAETAVAFTLSAGQVPVDEAWMDPVRGAFWSGNDDLVVPLGDNTVRLVPIGSQATIAEAPIVFEIGAEPFLTAVTPSSYFLVSTAGEEKVLLTEVDRATNDVVAVRDFDAWGAGVAVNPDGEAIISVGDRLILPSGEEIQMDGLVHNVGW